MTTRLKPDHRRAQIIAAAKNLSANGKLYHWNLQSIADYLGISRPLVAYYFSSAQGLRAEIITTAIKEREVSIVIQAMAYHDPLVLNLDEPLRRACVREMLR